MISEQQKAERVQERAGYIFEVAGDLAAMARAGDMGMLAYILDMARLEARHYFEREIGKSPDDSNGRENSH